MSNTVDNAPAFSVPVRVREARKLAKALGVQIHGSELRRLIQRADREAQAVEE